MDPTLAALDGALGAGDQACNECRRRKARCDKALPECGPCKKNRRHCLYERHSKTPLTRKHLTEVEERLRRAQLQVARAERRAQLAEERARQPEAGSPRSPTRRVPSPVSFPVEQHHVALEEPAIPLEAPPTAAADFSWDEQSQDLSPEADAPAGRSPDGDPEDRVVDGMASLSVEDEGGYLGVASGAAMLRLLLPDAAHPRSLRRGHTPCQRSSSQSQSQSQLAVDPHWLETPLWDALNISAIDLDGAMDAYFGLYHQSYPIVHEPTFRAQYAQVIPRPSGRSWHALAFMIAAIGIFTTATGPTTVDRDLFMAAKSNISIDSLETGNLTLVQTLTLMSNYLQKRNKPNSGYNYLGLALHMAMALGLHKEFHDWDISPLNMEIRRRVWWCMFVFYIGAAITFGRPLAWPDKNVEVSLPLNVPDRSLTNLSWALPATVDHITTYSSVIMQSRFHMLTNQIYTRVVQMPYPSASELLHLDDSLIGSWESSIPPWYREDVNVPPQFSTGHGIMFWRLRNFRIIMYRPYVIRRALQARSQPENRTVPAPVQEAYDRCLREAKASIASINKHWSTEPKTRLAAWYALYFLFQASLIPCVCLRNEPASTLAQDWREQISTTLQTIKGIAPVNPSGQDCFEVIQRLCGPFLETPAVQGVTPAQTQLGDYPTEESPQTQISNVYAMMWPNANPTEVDLLMQDGGWTNFLPRILGAGALEGEGTDQLGWT